MATPLDAMSLYQRYQAADQARAFGEQQLGMGPLRRQAIEMELAAKQDALAQQQQTRGVLARLAQGGNPEQIGQALMSSNPELGARLIGLALQDRAQRETERFHNLSLAQRAEAIRNRSLRPIPVRDPVSGEVAFYDPRTLKPVQLGDSSRPDSLQPSQIPLESPPLMASVPRNVEMPLGTGGTGFFGNLANKAAEFVGQRQPFPDVDKAINAFKNLRVQTVSMLQEAIPGRPSNFLMQRLEELAVEPNSLFMGDQASEHRLTQTREMLDRELKRMKTDILDRPGMYRPQQVSDTRANYSQLNQVLREYDAMLGSFAGVGKEKQPQQQGGWSIKPLP